MAVAEINEFVENMHLEIIAYDIESEDVKYLKDKLRENEIKSVFVYSDEDF